MGQEKMEEEKKVRKKKIKKVPLKTETDGVAKKKPKSKCRSKSIRDVYNETLEASHQIQKSESVSDQPDGFYDECDSGIQLPEIPQKITVDKVVTSSAIVIPTHRELSLSKPRDKKSKSLSKFQLDIEKETVDGEEKIEQENEDPTHSKSKKKKRRRRTKSKKVLKTPNEDENQPVLFISPMNEYGNADIDKNSSEEKSENQLENKQDVLEIKQNEKSEQTSQESFPVVKISTVASDLMQESLVEPEIQKSEFIVNQNTTIYPVEESESNIARSSTRPPQPAPRTLSSRSKVSKISKFSEKSIERPSFPPPKLNAEKSKSKKKSKSRRKKSKKSKSRVSGAEKLADLNNANFRIDRIDSAEIERIVQRERNPCPCSIC